MRAFSLEKGDYMLPMDDSKYVVLRLHAQFTVEILITTYTHSRERSKVMFFHGFAPTKITV